MNGNISESNCLKYPAFGVTVHITIVGTYEGDSTQDGTIKLTAKKYCKLQTLTEEEYNAKVEEVGEDEAKYKALEKELSALVDIAKPFTETGTIAGNKLTMAKPAEGAGNYIFSVSYDDGLVLTKK